MELFLTMRKRADFPNMMTYTPEDMPMDVVLRALDIVAESKSPQVLFKGNEAFLHPDLEMILKGCQKRGNGYCKPLGCANTYIPRGYSVNISVNLRIGKC